MSRGGGDRCGLVLKDKKIIKKKCVCVVGEEELRNVCVYINYIKKQTQIRFGVIIIIIIRESRRVAAVLARVASREEERGATAVVWWRASGISCCCLAATRESVPVCVRARDDDRSRTKYSSVSQLVFRGT